MHALSAPFHAGPRWFCAAVVAALAGLCCVSAPAGAAPATQAAAGSRGAATRPTAITEYCATPDCHASLLGRKFMHGPTAQQKCLACHQYDEPREHRFKLASAQATLCGDCHTLQHRTVVHTPVEQGRCTGCHDPHGSDQRAMLIADPTRGLCLTCHKQDFSSKKFIHGPVNTGACILCHEPHSAWQPKLLVAAPDQLCGGCHSEVTPKGEQARHVHEPLKSGQCTACHDPHASDLRYQLRDAPPRLCLSCHKDIGKLLADSRVLHGPVQATATPAAPDSGPISAGSCTACHNPHFSQLPKLQRASQPESCLNCHNKSLKDAAGKELTDMAELLKTNPQHHGPIREGACTACHQPHAANTFRLLAAEYPPEFYAPFKVENYALCFKCHIPDLVLKQQGAGLTRFRNGDLNLHWVHVNREKGRTCRACHEVHASRNPFHIRDSVPFGSRGWMLEIDYKQSAAGGSCSPGCHQLKTYSRGDDAPANTPAQEASDGHAIR